MGRTQHGNNNAYNVDSTGTWLDWSGRTREAELYAFARRLLSLRAEYGELRPKNFWSSDGVNSPDSDGDGLFDFSAYTDNGTPVTEAYLDDPNKHFITYRVDVPGTDGPRRSLLVLYNGWHSAIDAKLPESAPGFAMFGVLDSSQETQAAGPFAVGARVRVEARSALVIEETRFAPIRGRGDVDETQPRPGR